jgi:uncharacterized membrane-anchored protein
MTTIRILIVLVLQAIALAWMIGDRQSMLDAGRVVTLKVVPVDPRDIFRGDYVVLNYDVSRVDVHVVAGDDEFQSGDTAYVTLKQNGEYWGAVAISHKPPTDASGLVTLKANVSYQDPVVAAPNAGDLARWVSLSYGVESYFVPQGTGHAIEEEARKGVLSVDVAVDANGRAAIKAMRRAGKVFYVEGIF